MIYCICAWDEYYPGPGLQNIKASFLSKEKAEDYYEAFDKTTYDYVKFRTLVPNDFDYSGAE